MDLSLGTINTRSLTRRLRAAAPAALDALPDGEQALGTDQARATWPGAGRSTRRKRTPRTLRCRSPSTRISCTAPATRAKATTRSCTGAPWPRRSEPGRARLEKACARCGSPAPAPTCASSSKGAAGSVGREAQHARRRGLHEPRRDRDERRDLLRHPSVFQGQEVELVRCLRFEDGAVVHAEATVGQEYLRSLLDTDSGCEGARRGRVRPELRDRPLHARHPLRREDRRNDARRARRRLRRGRHGEQIGHATGT